MARSSGNVKVTKRESRIREPIFGYAGVVNHTDEISKGYQTRYPANRQRRDALHVVQKCRNDLEAHRQPFVCPVKGGSAGNK